MNNFNQISKILKSSLKKKITITAATIVTFLMTGAVSYAITNDKDITEVQQPCATKTWVAFDTSIVDREGGEVINNGTIDVGVYYTDENEEKKGNINLHGIYVDSSKSFSITNNGTISLKTNTPNKIWGIYGKAGNEKSEIINNGNIIINNTLSLLPSFLSENRENPAGIAINGKNITAINKGKILTEGFGLAGMAASNGATLINDKTGTIDITKGKFSYGMYGENANLINNGNIILSFGEGDSLNFNQNIAIYNYNGAAVNNGTIVIKDKSKDELKDFTLDSIFYGNVLNNGIIQDSNGESIVVGNGLELSGIISSAAIEKMLENSENKVINVISSDATIKTNEKTNIDADVLNIAGHTLTIANKILDNSFNLNGITINIDKFGQIKIGDAGSNSVGSLVVNNGVINGSRNFKAFASDIVYENSVNTLLTLNNTIVQNAIIGNITSIAPPLIEENEENKIKNNINIYGDTYFNNSIVQATNINIGDMTKLPKENKLHLSKDSQIVGSGNLNIGTNGQLVLEVGEDGTTGLTNSRVNITGDNIAGNGDILLNTSILTGAGITVDLGSATISKENLPTLDITTINNNKGVYIAKEITIDKDGKASSELRYNTKLFEDGKINDVNNAAMNANDLFENNDLEVRKEQMENIYHGSIFAKTVKASYTGVKLTEDKLRELPNIAQVGKWSVLANGIHSANKTTDSGYNNKIKTSGLVAAMEYGMDSNTSVGIALSGAYQDVIAATGKADGQLIYLGTYAKREYGPYKFTAGIGYQYGRYDADNTTGYVNSSDKYSSNTLSTYVEGKYSMDIDETITFEPKVKLGYTHVKQKHAKDSYIGVSNAKLSTADAEIGADIIKTIALEDGKVDLSLGASYVRAMGDTDKEFKGEFVKSNGNFNIEGANIAKNTGKFDLAVKVTKDSGMFYNGGISYQVGSDKTKDYSVTVGLGYRF